MKKGLFLMLLTILTLSGMFAFEKSALVKSFSGKVEYRTGTGAWTPLTDGLKIPLGSTISTGFDSRAVLEIGTATLAVAPLTRMSINDLVEKNGTVSTGLYLQVGMVKTQVKKVEGVQNDFVIKSPVTTASVRGTVFDFDSVNLNVNEGIVLMTDQYKQSLRVHHGESSSGREAGSISGGSGARDDAVQVSWDTTDFGGPQAGTGISGSDSTTRKGLQFGAAKVHLEYTYVD